MHFQKETNVMFTKVIWIGLTLSLVGFMSAATAGQDLPAREIPIAAAIQTTPLENIASVATVPNNSLLVVGTTGVRQIRQNARNTRQLPQTASALPLIVLLGLGSVGAAFGLTVFGKHATA
jgi:hypothetical protein